MRRAGRLAWSATLVVLHVTVLFGLVAATLLLALSAGFQRDRLRSFLQSSLERTIQGPGGGGPRIEIGALEGPLYPQVSLRDVSLSDEGTVPLRIAKVSLRFDLRSLWRERTLVIDELQVQGLVAQIERDPGGEWSWQHFWPSAPKGGEESSAEALTLWPTLPVEIQLRQLTVEESRITVRSEQAASPSRVVARASLLARDITLPRQGPPPWPTSADLELNLEPGLVEGRALEGANLALELEGPLLRLKSSRLESRFGRARVEGQTDLAGWFDPARGGSVALDASWESLDLSIPLMRPELAGHLNGKVRIEGFKAAGTPLEAARIRAELSLSPSRLGAVRIAAAEFEGSYDAGRWELGAASFKGSGLRVQGAGRGDLEELQRFDLDASADDLSQIAVLFGFGPREIGGAAHLSAKLSGAFSRPRGHVDLVASKLHVREMNLGGARAEIAARGDGHIRIEALSVGSAPWRFASVGPVELQLERSGVSLKRAEFELPGRGRGFALGRFESGALHSLRVELQGVAVHELAPLVWDHADLAGALALSIVADGPLSGPTLTGRATWSSPRIDRIEAEELSVDFRAASPEARASARLLLGGQELLTATLSTPYEALFDPLSAFQQPSTRITLHGVDLDLARAGPWFPDLVGCVRGTASLGVELQGGRPEPEVSGDLAIRDASFDVPMLGERLGPLEARIKLEHNAVQVETASLAGGRGSANLSGRVALTGIQPAAADLTLELAGFEVRREQDLTGRLDGLIKIEGPAEGLEVHGKVVLNQARLRLTSQRNPLFREIHVRQLASAPSTSIREGVPPTLDIFGRAAVDLRLEVPRDTWIVGQGAHVEIEGAIEAHKSPPQPLFLVGGIDVVRGSYRLEGRLFQIEEGHATFTGRTALDPGLDVLATTRVSDVKILATIGGTASAPTLRLESDPPYPQNDVLALLLFGRTSDSLAQPEAGALGSFVAGAAGGALLNQMGEAVGPRLPVDTLAVTASETGSGTTIGAGRYLTPDVYLHYDNDVGGSQTRRVRVDWRLTKQLTLESRTSSDGNSSADLIFTYDY